jgi:hypothetical protein
VELTIKGGDGERMNKKELIWKLMELREQDLDNYDFEFKIGYRDALNETIDLIMPFLVKIKENENES